MLEHFHFIHPWWLLALLPLLLLAWRVHRSHGADNAWSRIVDARLLPLLMVSGSRPSARSAPRLAALGWTLAALALANPTWERKPQPVYQTNSASVVVLDLAPSMLSTDLLPSRLVRARYKVQDVLDHVGEGRTGLVVYAGDAFTVSPLTRDVNTIRAQLKVLEPSLMPASGSRADLGLLKAEELLRQAGVSHGQVLLLADAISEDKAAAERAAAQLQRDGYTVSVLGIGAGAEAPLQVLARAGGGHYRSFSDDGSDLKALLAQRPDASAATATQTDVSAQGWKEQGPLLVLLLLPLAALAFRRNWLLGVALVACLAAPPQPALASTWDDLWQRPDQQAAKALIAADYTKASALATDASRRGSADYKREKFDLALDNFSHAQGNDADYNRGNALAKLGRYQEAIAAYDKAIKDNAGAEDARANKAAVQALLKQQAQEKPSQEQKDSAKKDPKSGAGASQNASQNKNGKSGQGGQDSQSGQSGASPGQGQGTADASQAKGGSGGEQSVKAGQDAAKSQQQDGQPPGSASAKPGNQFELAAQKLAQAAEKLAAAAKQMLDPSGSDKAPSEPASKDAAAGNASAGPQAHGNAQQRSQGRAPADAQPLDSEERMAAQQWLRRIPDDPGGLLRRKFLYQYRQRTQPAAADVEP